MKISLCFAELHNALFLNGTNLNLKLDIKNRPELSLTYDREEKELLVVYKGVLAIVPSSNVSSMTPIDPSILGVSLSSPQPKPVIPFKGKGKAQVSTPHDHVFATNPGKTKDPK